MDGRQTLKKRGRSIESEESDVRKSSEKTLPTKRHTRSQSRWRLSTESLQPRLEAKNLTSEVMDFEAEEEPCSTKEMDASNVKSLSEMALFFEKKLSSLLTKEYMDTRLTNIEEKSKETADCLTSLEQRVSKIEN